ncbi:TIGR04552 family protein [Bacteriovorax sp. Seq25_V]|uniref:TIGR04552 family protein n=1 Tax=Bacteriovorax sp. Seq25_V TaxID=1201288 RepID=UPI00038A2E8C|nr:TIGR04552 family protein [Bacteriovorax sp. Seq25_V]EQC43337.1 hypothetical protein M900_0222 [Bacteriovorax sp. Seq25_V]
MSRPDYLNKYIFDWDLFNVVVGGKSALDSRFLISQIFNVEQVNSFLKGYGLDPNDPVSRAELFGNFQEAMQFIRRYFLKEGDAEGLDLKIPNSLYMITDVRDLFLMATGNSESDHEERLWAEIILKVMHTILHADKDLRSNYFNIIQTQIFDRFYKYLHRDSDNNLFLKRGEYEIPLIDFETKSKKTRDSVIIKLLHKAENVAEELFDRVGIRFVTKSKFDCINVVKFLIENNVVIPHNIKPSRSVNTIIDLEKFKKSYSGIVKMAIRNNLSEDRFLAAVNREINECYFFQGTESERNAHTSKNYQSIQFTCRQLVKYKNPFLTEFLSIRKEAKKDAESPISQRILNLDTSLIARDVRFFYPYEVQVVDEQSHIQNTQGEASHIEYKKAQRRSAMKRVFKELLAYKNLV